MAHLVFQHGHREGSGTSAPQTIACRVRRNKALASALGLARRCGAVEGSSGAFAEIRGVVSLAFEQSGRRCCSRLFLEALVAYKALPVDSFPATVRGLVAIF
jgi:hypothetical protein